MAGSGAGGLGDHDPLSVGSYSQLLLSDDIVDDLDAENCLNFTSSFLSDQNTPKMLCFGDDPYSGQECDLFFEEVTTKIAQKTAGITCSDSSSAASTTTINTASTPSTTTNNVSSLTKSNKRKNVSGAGVVKNSEPVGNSSGLVNGAPAPGKQRNCKRTKPADDSTETTTRHAKVKKEKLGERVIALQQLVSPFGKTDTASVLHEAMGYIRFLQEQVQVLCSPYLQRLPSSAHLLEKGGEGGESRKDLRSTGLCLVPIELTVHVAETNGADFWSPAMVNKSSSSNHQ